MCPPGLHPPFETRRFKWRRGRGKVAKLDLKAAQYDKQVFSEILNSAECVEFASI